MEEMDATNCPENMVVAFKQLQQVYNEGLIFMQLGTEYHGAHTNMNSITVGIDQMMLTILNNFHDVPKEYQDSSAFFVVGHEFAHITTHPGKDRNYWVNGAKEFPVEHYQKGRWLNAISDIIVNWSVMTGSNIYDTERRKEIQPQMFNGFRASEFLRECSFEENGRRHAKLLEEGKVSDNRYQPSGGIKGQYDNADPSDPFKPTLKTPFYQKFTGHGRGNQIYPPISYCTANSKPKNWRQVRALKSEGILTKGKVYEVTATYTYDGRKNQPFEPVRYYEINGSKVSPRYVETLCPHCGQTAKNTWDNWWDFVPKEKKDAMIAQRGTWVHLLIQMFAFQWAAIYSTMIKYNGETSRKSGKAFLRDISEDMDKVMRSE